MSNFIRYKPYAAPLAFSYNYATRLKPTGRPSRTSNYRKPYRKAARGKGSFRSQVMAVFPAKHYTGETTPTLVHNTITTMIPTQGITQGNGNTQRDGDSITLEALKLKGTVVTNAVAGAYQYRIIVGYTGEEYTTANIGSTLQSGIGSSELFLPNFSVWLTNALINPKAFTALYDETIDVNSQLSAIQDVANFNVTVPLHTSFAYQSSGSVQGKTRNLAVLVIGNVAGGVTGTTASGQMLLSYDLLFKNN